MMKLFLTLSISFLTLAINSSALAYQSTSDPELLTDDISIKPILELPSSPTRISFNKADGNLYMIRQNGVLSYIDIEAGSNIYQQGSSDHGLGDVQGMDISDSGEIYLVGNSRNNQDFTNTAVVMKGVKTDDSWSWSKVAETEPYPLSNTAFDHIANAIVISPDQSTLYINSGSRTDHGEVHDVDGRYPNLREAPLTAKILKVPADADGLVLENDIDFLRSNGYIHAEGTRNSFTLAFDAEGNLFGGENAGDRDDPEELNWLREGQHYGFPWIIGGNETPMQFDGYDWENDPFVDPNSTAANGGFFYNDPNYPAPPEGVTFSSAVVNTGPDVDNYRDATDGQIKDASDQDTVLTTFVSHLSPSGLVFDIDGNMGGDYQGDGFIMGFSSTTGGAFLIDRMNYIGGNLIHLELTKNEAGDNFEAKVTNLISGFLNPIDSEIIGNKIYVLEFGNESWLNANRTIQLYEVTFPRFGTSNEQDSEIAAQFSLSQNYPNPFNPTTNIPFELKNAGFVEIEVSNTIGKKVASLVNRSMSASAHETTFDASALPSGVYFYTLKVDGVITQTKKMLLLK
jgi:glucose/arabinose dehydrogenase